MNHPVEVFWPVVSIVAFFIGVWLGFTSQPDKINAQAAAREEPPPTVEDIPEEVAEEYTVAGKPRRKPWKERRRELEFAARSERRKLEEWRD